MSADVLSFEVDKELDVMGLACPLPILKAKATLTKMRSGEVLHVLATDPLAPLDFRAFCLRSDHEMLHLVETKERSEFFIRKA